MAVVRSPPEEGTPAVGALPRVRIAGVPGPWTPDSWRAFADADEPINGEAAVFAAALVELGQLPPLVTAGEVLKLKHDVASAQRGEAFIVQGVSSTDRIAFGSTPLQQMLRLAFVLACGLKRPVVPVACLDWRRSAHEVPGGVDDDADVRPADVQNLLDAHGYAAMASNMVRAFTAEPVDIADSLRAFGCSLDGASSTAVRGIQDILISSAAMMQAVAPGKHHKLRFQYVSTSRGIESLRFEEALTRSDPIHPGWFNLSSDLPTLDVNVSRYASARVEYLRGIRNPLAVMIAPTMPPHHLLEIIDTLNPENEPGRIVLIHGMAPGYVDCALEPILNAVRQSGRLVLWAIAPLSCRQFGLSPDAGGTDGLAGSMLEGAVRMHERCGTRLGGMRLPCDLLEYAGSGEDVDGEEGALELALRFIRAMT